MTSSLRLILGTVFLASSISKATQPRLFAITIAKFKLVPSTWSLSVSLTLIAIQLLIAVSLFVGWRIRLIALLSGVLLPIFTTSHLKNVILSEAKNLYPRKYETLRLQRTPPQSDIVFLR